MSVLVLGYGNPAREDDGLGPMVADRIGDLALEGVEVDTDYQLTVEDSVRVARAQAVVLVDAAKEGPAPFRWSRVQASGGGGFCTHALTAGGVVNLARELFGAHAPVYLLGVRGYSFRMFTQTPTAKARRNAGRAVTYLADRLRRGRLGEDP